MDSKIFICMTICFLGLTGCSGGPSGAVEDENRIGTKLEAVSDISGSHGGGSNTISIFDETVRKIHRFSLLDMKHLNSIEVKHPEAEHFVLYDSAEGRYTIDLTKEHLSIYSKDGTVLHNPVTFAGTPVSAAFRPDLGYFIVYDDLQSVAIIKMSDQGTVLDALVLGPIVDNESSIQAGEINDSAKLILSLSDDSLVVADLAATLIKRDWSFTRIVKPGYIPEVPGGASEISALTNMRWIGTVNEHSEQILIRASDKIALFDLATEKILSSVEIDDRKTRIEKYSKSKDPHIIFRRHYWEAKVKMVFVKDGALISRSLFHADAKKFLISRLDLKRDQWTLAESDLKFDRYFHNDINAIRGKRLLKQYKLSSMLVKKTLSLPDGARLSVSSEHVFSLYPSELGYATRTNIATQEKSELKLFNLRLIKK